MARKSATRPGALPVDPAAGRKYRWLPLLARAFDAVDHAVAEELKARAAAGAEMPACKAGCSACCRDVAVPVTAVEFMGLSWYVSEVVTGPERKVIRAQLRSHRTSRACPFLVRDHCAAYPARPLACRHLYMLGRGCLRGEDVLTSRPEQILSLGRAACMEAAALELRAMEFGSERKCREAAQRGALFASARPMHRLPLHQIANVMDAFDARRSGDA